MLRTAGTGTCSNAIKGWGGLIHFNHRRSPTGMSLQVLREDDGSEKVVKDLEVVGKVRIFAASEWLLRTACLSLCALVEQ